MQDFAAWLGAHWKDLLLAVVAIDSALVPLFPDSGLLKKIKDVLSSFFPGQPK